MKQPVPGVAPDPPPGAREMFAQVDDDRFALVERLCGILATAGVERGLIGPREAPRLWQRHLLNCAVLAEVVGPAATVGDIGSGAGLPGLVLALGRPDLQVTLLEPLLRRSTFLSETIDDLGLGAQVRVVRARAEQWHGRDRFDVVTARAVAPLPRLLEWAMPLVAPTGVLLAMKGGSAAAEITAAAQTLTRLRCAAPEVLELGTSLSTARVVRVAHADPTRVSWPPTGGATTTKRRPDA